MNMQEIVSIISNIGFPIACCVMLWLRMVKQDENHKAEMQEFSTAIDNNTKAIELLIKTIGDEHE